MAGEAKPVALALLPRDKRPKARLRDGNGLCSPSRRLRTNRDGCARRRKRRPPSSDASSDRFLSRFVDSFLFNALNYKHKLCVLSR